MHAWVNQPYSSVLNILRNCWRRRGIHITVVLVVVKGGTTFGDAGEGGGQGNVQLRQGRRVGLAGSRSLHGQRQRGKRHGCTRVEAQLVLHQPRPPRECAWAVGAEEGLDLGVGSRVGDQALATRELAVAAVTHEAALAWLCEPLLKVSAAEVAALHCDKRTNNTSRNEMTGKQASVKAANQGDMYDFLCVPSLS